MYSISSKGLENLEKNVRSIYLQHYTGPVKAAAYCPKDLQFGLARIYEVWSEESPETVVVFRNLEEAIEWIRN